MSVQRESFLALEESAPLLRSVLCPIQEHKREADAPTHWLPLRVVCREFWDLRSPLKHQTWVSLSSRRRLGKTLEPSPVASLKQCWIWKQSLPGTNGLISQFLYWEKWKEKKCQQTLLFQRILKNQTFYGANVMIYKREEICCDLPKQNKFRYLFWPCASILFRLEQDCSHVRNISLWIHLRRCTYQPAPPWPPGRLECARRMEINI